MKKASESDFLVWERTNTISLVSLWPNRGQSQPLLKALRISPLAPTEVKLFLEIETQCNEQIDRKRKFWQIGSISYTKLGTLT